MFFKIYYIIHVNLNILETSNFTKKLDFLLFFYLK